MFFPFFVFLPYLFYFLIIYVVVSKLFGCKNRQYNKRDLNRNYNNSYSNDPIIPARATVIYKRGSESFDRYGNNYIVFEFDSRDRIELVVPREEANLIFEGEKGTLTFQGRRFLKFDRNTN